MDLAGAQNAKGIEISFLSYSLLISTVRDNIKLSSHTKLRQWLVRRFFILG